MSRIEGIEKVNRVLANIPSRIKAAVIKIFNQNAVEMQKYLRVERLTGGTTDTKLGVRSGRLRASVAVIRAHEEGESIKGGVSLGTVYARTHIGPKGQKTTIRPKPGHKYLTIPLDAALSGAGVPRGTARNGPWGKTFFATSKKGNLILFGRRMVMKGKNVGQIRGGILPLFVLKKQVVISARIDPLDAIKHVAPMIMRDLREEGFKGAIE